MSLPLLYCFVIAGKLYFEATVRGRGVYSGRNPPNRQLKSSIGWAGAAFSDMCTKGPFEKLTLPAGQGAPGCGENINSWGVDVEASCYY